MSGVQPYFDDEQFLEEYEEEPTRYAIVSDVWLGLDYVEADSWLHAFERWLLEVRGWTGYDRFAGKSYPEEPYDEVRFGADGVFYTALIVPAEVLEGADD